MRNRMFMHTPRDDSLLGTMRFVSKHADSQVYGAILLEEMTNQALWDSIVYKTNYAIALGVEPLQIKKQKKSESAISSIESPSKKKPAKAKKDAATKPKPSKKKALVKADTGKDLNVLSEVALFKAVQVKEVTRRSKKEFHASHASGLGDKNDLGSRVLDEQQYKIPDTHKGIGIKPGVPDITPCVFRSYYDPNYFIFPFIYWVLRVYFYLNRTSEIA
ncbi:hypothetical protein Tco_0780103 [Tanacetum coccineum]